MNRGGLAPIGFGLLIGVAGGLIYGWLIQPVRFTETSPQALRADFQDDYVALIAAAYAATGDLPRAEARLALLPGAGETDRLAALAQARLAAGRPDAEVQALAALAAALDGERPTAAPSATSAPTRVSTAAATPPPVTALPRASPQPTFTPGAPFRVGEKTLVCDDPSPLPRLQVIVMDSSGEGVPNVQVRVLWDSGQDQFFTGLKPELGIGFGDFELEPGIEYTVQLGESEAIARGIQAESCTDASGQTRLGSWRLTFIQPGAP